MELTREVHREIDELVRVELPKLRSDEAAAQFAFRLAESDLRHEEWLLEEEARLAAEAREEQEHVAAEDAALAEAQAEAKELRARLRNLELQAELRKQATAAWGPDWASRPPLATYNLVGVPLAGPRPPSPPPSPPEDQPAQSPLSQPPPEPATPPTRPPRCPVCGTLWLPGEATSPGRTVLRELQKIPLL